MDEFEERRKAFFEKQRLESEKYFSEKTKAFNIGKESEKDFNDHIVNLQADQDYIDGSNEYKNKLKECKEHPEICALESTANFCSEHKFQWNQKASCIQGAKSTRRFNFGKSDV
jgi:hypothetical protein